MNPGPELGLNAVVQAYTVVLGAILVFVVFISNRQKRLERRRKELQEHAAR